MKLKLLGLFLLMYSVLELDGNVRYFLHLLHKVLLNIEDKQQNHKQYYILSIVETVKVGDELNCAQGSQSKALCAYEILDITQNTLTFNTVVLSTCGSRKMAFNSDLQKTNSF